METEKTKEKKHKLNLTYQVHLEEYDLKVLILNALQSQFQNIEFNDISILLNPVTERIEAKIIVSRELL